MRQEFILHNIVRRKYWEDEMFVGDFEKIFAIWHFVKGEEQSKHVFYFVLRNSTYG